VDQRRRVSSSKLGLRGLLFFLLFPPTAPSDPAGEEVEGEDDEARAEEEETLAVPVMVLVHLTRGSLADREAQGKGGLGKSGGGGNSSAMRGGRGALGRNKVGDAKRQRDREREGFVWRAAGLALFWAFIWTSAIQRFFFKVNTEVLLIILVLACCHSIAYSEFFLVLAPMHTPI
jgi:hypothetical protein